MELYWDAGLHRFSLNEVARRAGISKPALYREFGGEDGLMEASLELYRLRLVVPLLQALEEERPFGEMLKRAVTRLTAPRAAPAGCLFTKMRLAGPRLGPQTRRRVREVEDEQLTAFEARLLRARSSGELAPGIEPQLGARYLDTQFATVLVQMGVGVPRPLVRAQARLALGALVAGKGVGPTPR